MTIVMLKLGNFKFGLETAAFDELSQSFSYNWASQAKLNTTPAKQFTGESDRTASFSCTAYPGQLGERDFALKLHEAATEGKPLLMITATGTITGYWCITGISLSNKRYRGALPAKQTFDLKLSYYGERYEN